MVKIANSSPIIAQPVYTVDPATGNPTTGGSGGSSAATPTGPAGTPNTSVVTVQGIANATPVIIQGAVPHATADSGNPVKIGGFGSSAIPTAVANGQRVNAWYGSFGEAKVTIVDATVGNPVIQGRSLASDAFSTAPSSILMTQAYNMVFNGTTYDRQRGDTSGAYIASSSFWTESTTALAASATVNGALRSSGGAAGGVGSRFGYFTSQVYVNATGGTLFVDMSLDAGTTWKQVGSQAAAANTCVSVKVPVQAASYRSRFVNGTNAVSDIVLTNSYSTS